MSRIPEALKEKIKYIPSKPGVYQMKDARANIMYIGKSKSLKSRVKSYFYTQDKSNKIKRMMFHINDIDFIVTDTHLEAQILECALIKKSKPIYNTQLKNHEKYMYLEIENFNRFKPVNIVHERDASNCFGPYKSKGMLLEIVKFFQNAYPITKCEGTYEFTYKVMPQSIERDDFEKNRESLVEIFSDEGCMLEFLSQIEKKMNKAAAKMQFERASIYRDMQNHMRYLHDYNTRKSGRLNHGRVLMGERIEAGYKIFYISNGSIILKKKYKKPEKEDVEQLLVQAKEIESRALDIKNEKRDLDFKYIVNAEIQDKASKALLFIDGNCDVDEFMGRLVKIV